MPLATIQKIVKDCSVSDTTNHSITLKEDQNTRKPGTLSKVVIKKAHGSVYFSIDRKNKKWSPYLIDSDAGFQKKCDYVIITYSQDIIKTIFIELKSSTPNTKEFVTKFKATECFIDYCNIIAKHFFDKEIINNAEKRFVVFYHHRTSISKTPTRPPRLHSKPENAQLVCVSQNTKIWLKQLL